MLILFVCVCVCLFVLIMHRSGVASAMLWTGGDYQSSLETIDIQ